MEGTTIGAGTAGPNFVGVGVQKAGTTWVAWILEQHPQIHFAKEKELSFFTRRFHKGWKWYETHFCDKGDRIAGEFSVNYIYSPRPEPTRKQFYPNFNPRPALLFWRKAPSARLELFRRYRGLQVFAMFRDPAERAWSHYWYWRRRRERMGKPIVPFEKMFADDGRWIRLQGMYASHYEDWRKSFPAMGIFFYDDLKSDPYGLASDIYRFLGVDDEFEPKIDKRFHEGNYPPMPRETRAKLVEAYRGQIDHFASMTSRDLRHWTQVD